MELESYFDNVPDIIQKELENAEYSIVAAVAWLTEGAIFQTLCDKANKGLYVVLVILDHEINNDSGIDFKQLEESGGQLYTLKSGKNYMHHKFCVIDNKTIITGSANWTNNAYYNNENAVVIKDHLPYVTKFLVEFYSLFKIYNLEVETPDSKRALYNSGKKMDVEPLLQLNEKDFWDAVRQYTETNAAKIVARENAMAQKLKASGIDFSAFINKSDD